MTQNVLKDTGGVEAPYQCPLERLAMLPWLYTDVRSLCDGFIGTFKGTILEGPETVRRG